MLGKHFSRQQCETFFSYFSQKIGFYIACKLSQKSLSLFSGEKKERYCLKILYTKVTDKMVYANNADPDQTAP